MGSKFFKAIRGFFSVNRKHTFSSKQQLMSDWFHFYKISNKGVSFRKVYTFDKDLLWIWLPKLYVLKSCTFCKYNIRSSRSQMFFKIGVLKNLANFTGKQLCWSLFLNKVAGLQASNFVKKRLQHRLYYVKFAKFPRTLFL